MPEPEQPQEWADFTGAEGLRGEDRLPKTGRGQRTRQAFMDAARRTFHERGYTHTRVADIALQAGMSQGAFYRYFDDKHHLIRVLVEEMLKGVFEVSRHRWNPANPRESIYWTTKRYFEFYTESADLYSVVIEVAQHDATIRDMWNDTRARFVERITRALQQGREQGTVRPQIDPALAAALLGGMTEHYAYTWLVLDQTRGHDIEEVTQAVTELWWHGLQMADPGEI